MKKILWLSLLLGLMLVATPLFSAFAQDTMPAPIDPQSWQMNRDRTWDDFVPNPVIDWMSSDFNPEGLTNPKALQEVAPSAFNRDPADILTPIRGALILVDFIDRPFISSQPLHSDLFGFGLSTGKGFESVITKNPVITHPDRNTLAAWWADYLNKQLVGNDGNHAATIDEFWRENSYGKWGVDLVGFGPYTLNGLELHYAGLGNDNTPPMLRAGGGYSLLDEAVALARSGADGKAPWNPDDFDFFFILHSGYDESGVWLNFGMMQWSAITLAQAKLVVPDAYGPKRKMAELEAIFTANPEYVENMAARTYGTNNAPAMPQSFRDEANKIAAMRTAGTLSSYEFKFPESEWEWAAANGNAATTRYVAWTAWAAHLAYWSGAGGTAYVSTKYNGLSRTLRRSVQGENDGMATFAHEFGHISGLGDNYGNPYTARVTAKTEPWELMSRGSFAGPFGDQARWTVPGIESSSVPVHFMAFNKGQSSINYYDEGDVLVVSKEGLASSTPVVAEIVARNIPMNNRKDAAHPNGYYPWLEEYGLISPNFYKAIRLNFGSGEWADQAVLKTAGHSQFLSRLSGTNARMFVEVVQRTGYDSFTPDDGVIISRNDCVVDSHPYDIALIEYIQKDGFGPGIDDAASYTVGHTAQLYDAAFHAGKSFTDTGYYRSEYDPADPHYTSEDPRYYAGEGNFSWQKNMLKTGSLQQWEDQAGREIASGETVNEFYDPGNKLHFYIFEKHMNPGKYGEFLSYSVGVLHDDGVPVGGNLNVSLVALEAEEPLKVAVATYTVTNTGDATDIIRLGTSGYLPGVLLNDLYAIGAGETITVKVYVELPGSIRTKNIDGETLTLTASSESNPTKTGSASVDLADLIVYNFHVWLQPQKDFVNAGENLYVDVMMQGNIPYTQIFVETLYDNNLFDFVGHENLIGWMAAVDKVNPNKLVIRSLENPPNMILGVPCDPAIKVVTLKFTPKTTENKETSLSFASALVTPQAGYIGAGTTFGKPIPIIINKPDGDFPLIVSYEGKWQNGLTAVSVEIGGRLAIRADYFTGNAASPTGDISSATAAIASNKSITFQWYINSINNYTGKPIDHAMGNDYIPNTGSIVPAVLPPYTHYYYCELIYTPDTANPTVQEHYYSDILKVTLTANSFPTNLLTPAETSGWQRTTSSAEVYAYCQSIAAISGGRIRLVNIGQTAGRATPGNLSAPQNIPMLIIGKPAPADPSQVSSDKAIALINAGIHSGEVEGKESMLIFAREFALGLHDDLLDDVVILLVPNFNADGNDYLAKQRINSQYTPKLVGSRFNGAAINPYVTYNATSESANWYNINRDMTKLDANESKAVVDILNEWDPVIFVDLHATNGSLMRHSVTFNWGLHPNTDPAIMAYNMSDFADKAVGKDSYLYNVQEKTTQPYGNFSGGSLVAGTTRWNSFEDYPRYTTNYAGLRNRLALLTEVYSHDPFTVRVDTQYACAYGVLLAIAEDKVKIKKLMADADAYAVGRELNGLNPAVDFVALNSTMQYLYDIKVETYKASATGSSPLSLALRDDENDRCGTVYAGIAEYTIPYYGNWTPTTKMPMGAKYILDADCTEAVALLEKHGIKVEVLAEPAYVNAGELQWFKGTRRAQSATSAIYEGHLRNNFTGDWALSTAKEYFPAGSYVVSTAQPLGALAALLLEPSSVDGAITWNYFDNQLSPALVHTVRSHYPFTTTDTGSPTYAMPVFKVMDYKWPITVDDFVPVEDIIDVPEFLAIGTPLTLTGTVIPTDATFQDIIWSIKDDGGTGATLVGDILNAVNEGYVTITATIINGKGLGIDFIKDFIIEVNRFYYEVYFVPDKSSYKPGDTIKVDLMLHGNINYFRLIADFIYETDLLTYTGYENLAGVVAQVTTDLPNSVNVKHDPSFNTIIGEPCEPPVRIVTLLFTVKDLPTDNTTTTLHFTNVVVANPFAAWIGVVATTSKDLTIDLTK
ncbi:MAG: hypothetical protein FWG61_06135 [Firmicutes bacterium]|nr:hypothetical protein [Bacillota bacterium]